MSMIRTGPSAGKEKLMYCGAVIKTRKKEASAHFQSCEACQAIRKEIRVRTCKKLEHTPKMRRKYSETAKKTAARPAIQQARAERYLAAIGFLHNTRLRCQKERKQIDFVHRQKDIVIEIDGPWHFSPIQSESHLQKVQAHDRMLNQEIIRRSWRLIRLSMQCFKGKSGELIFPNLSQLIAVIEDGSWEGIRCYGSLYEQRSWGGVKVMILK